MRLLKVEPHLFWHHYFLACSGAEGVTCGNAALEECVCVCVWGGSSASGWDRRGCPTFFSHVLPGQWKHWKTARSHQLSPLTLRPQEKAWVNTKGKATGWEGRRWWWMCVCVWWWWWRGWEKCSETPSDPPRCGRRGSTYYQPPVLHLT